MAVPATAGFDCIDVRGMQYAGFWRRLAAIVLDQVFTTLLFSALLLIVMTGKNESLSLNPSIVDWSAVVFVWLYHSLQESSAKQATWGKRVMGLVVSDMEGKRLGFVHATGRFLAHFLSWASFCIGFLVALVTPRRQALHDLVARTVVMHRGD